MTTFITHSGAVVGGSAVQGAAVAWVGAGIVGDLGGNVDPEDWATRGGRYGAAFGLALLAPRKGD